MNDNHDERQPHTIHNYDRKETTMKTRRIRATLDNRLDIGTAILAAARMVDSGPIRSRLSAFAGAQRRYAEAHTQLEAARIPLREAQVRLRLRDAEQDKAIERLAAALVHDGQPRTKPFEAFGGAAPSLIKQMQYADEAKAVHQLVASLQRNKAVRRSTLDVAQAADDTAMAVEAALRAVETLETALVIARGARDEAARHWEFTLSALKRRARAAADDGASDLYAALFSHQNRPAAKAAKPAPAPPPVPAPQAVT
jgi:hypothetical protein